MNFAILSPVVGLERYSILSKTHLLLSQIRIPGYWDFYLKRKQEGDFVILDNGAYEGQLDQHRLLECINLIKPNVVALPDHLGQHWKTTWHSSSLFLDSYFYEFENIEWMYIPQAEPGDIVGFIESLFRALDDARISWIGLPRVLSYSITNDLSMRVRMAEQIRRRNSRIRIHALGMVKGNVDEVTMLRNSGCVTSIDSNAPVWRGWCGYDLEEEWPEFKVDYNAKNFIPREWNTKHQVDGNEMILRNLEVCGVNTNVCDRAGSSPQGS